MESEVLGAGRWWRKPERKPLKDFGHHAMEMPPSRTLKQVSAEEGSVDVAWGSRPNRGSGESEEVN